MTEILTEILTENALFIALVSAVMTFFLGRYTSRLDDLRKGRKEMIETFYKPLIQCYLDEHHAYALRFTDLSLEAQDRIVGLLLLNENRVSPSVRRKIWDLDQCYSGYKREIAAGGHLSEEDSIFVEDVFQKIYGYVEKQCIRYERKLYCSIPERIFYCLNEGILKARDWWRFRKSQ